MSDVTSAYKGKLREREEKETKRTLRIQRRVTPLQQVPLLLASDPRRHLAGPDRDQWILELAPLAASFDIE